MRRKRSKELVDIFNKLFGKLVDIVE